MKSIETVSEFMLVDLQDSVVLRHYNLNKDCFYKVAEFPAETELICRIDKDTLLFGNQEIYQLVKVFKPTANRAQWIGMNLYPVKYLDDGRRGLKVIELNPALRQDVGFGYLVMNENKFYRCTRLNKDQDLVTAVDINGNQILFELVTDCRSEYESGIEYFIKVEEQITTPL